MAHLTCHECGKRYNHDIDESCPKCGAYTSPKGSAATQLEGELLARSHAARSHQQRGQRPPTQPNRSSRPNTTPSARQAEETKKKPNSLRTIIFLVVILFFLINMVAPVVALLIANFSLT